MEFTSIKDLIQDRNIVLVGGDIISTGGGFTRVPNFILVNPKISVGAKLAYAMLLKYAWQDDYCFPGQKRLAEDMGVSTRSVVEFIKELKRAGLINVVRRGQGKSNLYELILTPPNKPRKRNP